MLTSTETRWILNSSQVDIVKEWFKKYDQFFTEENSFSRQDYYLKTNSNNLGIKIREPKFDDQGKCIAKLELKSLLEDRGAHKFNNSNIGIINSWIKHSFDLDKETNPIETITNTLTASIYEDWLLIEKDRLLVKYNALSKKIVSGKDIIDNGAGIELTKFKFNNKIYHTLGIEAFAMSTSMVEIFFETIEFFFNSCQLSGLEHHNSKTYPEILQDN